MDQVKIGKYIASKRKELSLTQAQLAEKLGMSDKSVSKWERGVCLPDVSVYNPLCEILGITLNEFFAGEDLEEANVIAKSEENILAISRDSLIKSGRLKKIIGALSAIAIVLALIIVFMAAASGKFAKNYIRPLDSESAQMKTARLIAGAGSGNVYLFETNFSKKYTELGIGVKRYEFGKLISDSVVLSVPLDGEDSSEDGEIAIVMDREHGYVKLSFASGSTVSTLDREEENKEKYAHSGSGQIANEIIVKADTDLYLAQFQYSNGESLIFTPDFGAEYDEYCEALEPNDLAIIYYAVVK